MKDTQVGIIGGTGGMGRWFADFLRDQGYPVQVSGRTTGLVHADMAACCQVVVVSVPITATIDVIARIGPLLKETSLLMDLTSVKAEPVSAMLKHSRAEVIGCHPLFGPQTTPQEKRHVVLCPARTKQWLPWLRGVLECGGALITETTPEKHDELMAVVQGLNHFNTIMMGLALNEASAPLSHIDQYTTPFFDQKANMIKKVFSENPRLYAEILCNNAKMHEIIITYEHMIKKIQALILRKDTATLTDLLEQTSTHLWPPQDR